MALADAFLALLLASAAPVSDATAAADGTMVAAGVAVNGVDQGAVTLRLAGARRLVRIEDAARWPLDLRGVAPVTIDGAQWIAIDALPGAEASFSAADQRLDIAVAPEALARQQLSPAAESDGVAPAIPAIFVNYAVVAERYRGVSSFGVVGEAGVSSRLGVLSGSWALASGLPGTPATVRRLQTSWTFDDPARRRRLVLGDTITRPSLGGGGVPFIGLKYGTDFSLQPERVFFPLPRFSGEADAPSSVDLLVNGARRFTGSVAQGPFTIADVPITAGAGTATVLVRDTAGIQHAIDLPYYASTALLRPHIADLTVDIGWRDRNLPAGARYADPFVSAVTRIGVRDDLTLQGAGRVSVRGRSLGGAGTMLLGDIAELNVGAALSSAGGREAALVSVGVSRVSPLWSLSATFERRGAGFLDASDWQAPERVTRVAANGSVATPLGQFAFGWLMLEGGVPGQLRLASASYTRQLGSRLYASMAAQRVWSGGEIRDRAMASLSLLRGRQALSATIDGGEARIALQRSPLIDGPVGYRFAASTGPLGAAGFSELQAATTFGDFGVALGTDRHGMSGRVTAQGGLVIAGGMARATRRADDAFAVVSAPGAAHLRLYRDGQAVARTDAKGRAIVPGLRAYEHNRISFDPADLPITAIASVTDAQTVPRYRAASKVRLAIAAERGFSFHAADAQGAPLPAGSNVLLGADGESVVGNDGLIFLAGRPRGGTIAVETGPGERCVIDTNGIGEQESERWVRCVSH